MLVAKLLLLVLFKIDILLLYNNNYVSKMSMFNASSSDYAANSPRMSQEVKYEINVVSPDPSELPMPPQRWLTKDTSMDLLDAATDEALEHYWAGQVKACQYAIFHIC